MTRYIEWGDYGVSASGYIQRDRSDSTLVDPANPESVQALWSALPPDLRLALAKTAPKVASPWGRSEYPCFVEGFGAVPSWERGHFGRPAWLALVGDAYATSVQGQSVGNFKTLASAQSACDDALRAQGYVLDGDAP